MNPASVILKSCVLTGALSPSPGEAQFGVPGRSGPGRRSEGAVKACTEAGRPARFD